MKKIFLLLALIGFLNSKAQDVSTAVNLDVAWTDWSGSINPQGFSSTTTVKSRYLKIGKKCTIFVYVSGTSNATTATFTLPFAAANNSGDNQIHQWSVQNNGVGGTSNGFTAANSTTYTVQGTVFSSSSWVASGTKTFAAVISYETN